MNIALLLSGGTGLRIGGDIPKQYIFVNGQMIITYSIKTLMGSELIDALEIVADSKYHEIIRQEIVRLQSEENLADKPVYFCTPGVNRQMSIYNGLNAIKTSFGDKDIDTVFIHDAARPMLSMRVIADCYEALASHEGVIPVLPMKDTVYLSKDGNHITSLLNRSEVVAGQAPELFIFNKYLEANEALMPDIIMGINGSTEPAIMAGMDIVTIPGDEKNYKITTNEDLNRFRMEVENC